MDQVTSNSITIGKLQLTKDNGLYTVSAMVDGEPLWFQSADHPLRIAPEGFAGALLGPAMHLGKNLVFEDPLCPVWLANARQLMGIHHEWWGWPPVQIGLSQQDAPVHYAGDKTGLCFSAGVDSFYSLTTYPEPIDYVIMVHGYDIALGDEAGAAHAFGNAREIAEKYSVKPIAIKTNLRQHHISKKRFRNSHEGALSAMGYLVEDMNTLVISADYSREALRHFNHGLHWKTTPLRSSKDVKIIHYGEQYTRAEKIRLIASNPTIRKHLRVCQQNLRPDFSLAGQHLNCGKCPKCVLTLITLKQTTRLNDFECFANIKHLGRYLDRAEAIDDYTCTAYEKSCTVNAEPEVERAFRALAWRSHFVNKRPWLGRKGKKLLARLFMAWHNLKQRLVGE
jgi:hypothetical protein